MTVPRAKAALAPLADKMRSERGQGTVEYAVVLDGGHVAAIHGACSKINTNQRQYYAVRFL